MYKKLFISIAIVGLLSIACLFIFGSQINAKLIAYQGDLDLLFGAVFIFGVLLSGSLAYWAQKYDAANKKP